MTEEKCSGKVIVCIMLPIMTAVSVDQKLDIYIKKTQKDLERPLSNYENNSLLFQYTMVMSD
jgi:hypothetical protein